MLRIKCWTANVDQKKLSKDVEQKCWTKLFPDIILIPISLIIFVGFTFVTESLTFIAGTDSFCCLDSWYSLWTPVTLSSTIPFNWLKMCGYFLRSKCVASPPSSNTFVWKNIEFLLSFYTANESPILLVNNLRKPGKSNFTIQRINFRILIFQVV